MSFIYDKKTVLITGGSRGIGAAISTIFAENNYNIIINYCLNDEKANELKNELLSKYDINITLIKTDISNEDNVIKLMNEIKNKYEKIDTIVNNAGIAIDSTIEDKTVDNFKKILDTNLIGCFLISKYGKEILKDNGNIINISSTNAIDSFYPYSMDYDASKAGVISLTHNFAKLYAPNIRVNAIAPGWVNTEMNKELDEEYITEEESHILLNRFAEPSEIADAVYWAANATYLNDSIIKIDGGRC